MLTDEQNALLFHLSEYQVANKDTCYIVMRYMPNEYRKASYALRPLMRYDYITQRADGLYSITHKGRKVIDLHGQKCIVSCGGDIDSRRRVAYISKTAALLSIFGVWTIDSLSMIRMLPKNTCGFIPSPNWRKIRNGIISTTRFAGILLTKDMRLVVYHIGDGNMEWQTYAERSLFFETYGKQENRATGMLLICDDGKGTDIAKEIIKHTLWRDKTLIKSWNVFIFESDKKREFSKSPIQLHSQYNKVYLTEQSEIAAAIKNVLNENAQIRELREKLGGERRGDPQGPNFEVYPHRYFVNPANDLLRSIYMIRELRRFGDSEEVSYHAYLPEKYANIADRYNLNLEVHTL